MGLRSAVLSAANFQDRQYQTNQKDDTADDAEHRVDLS